MTVSRNRELSRYLAAITWRESTLYKSLEDTNTGVTMDYRLLSYERIEPLVARDHLFKRVNKIDSSDC